MRRPGRSAHVALVVLAASIALPVFAGGNDAPAIPPGGKHMSQAHLLRLDGGNDAPAIPPGGKHKSQSRLLRIEGGNDVPAIPPTGHGRTSESRSALSRWVRIFRLLTVVWGGE